MAINFLSLNSQYIPFFSTAQAAIELVAKIILFVGKIFGKSPKDFGCLEAFFHKVDTDSVPKILLKSIPVVGNIAIYLLNKKKTVNFDYLIKVDSKLFGPEYNQLTANEMAHFKGVLEKESIKNLIQNFINPLINRKYLSRAETFKLEMYMQLLFVTAGIKPVYSIEIKTAVSDDLKVAISQMCDEFKNVEFHQRPDGEFYLVNEEPLEIFNPREYYDYKSDMSLFEIFINQWESHACKGITYLLGYGPGAEEAFDRQSTSKNQAYEHDKNYKTANYEQIACSLGSNIETAKYYCLNVTKVFRSEEAFGIQKDRSELIRLRNNQFTGFIWDGICARTPYFKKAYGCRSYLIEKIKTPS